MAYLLSLGEHTNWQMNGAFWHLCKFLTWHSGQSEHSVNGFCKVKEQDIFSCGGELGVCAVLRIYFWKC